ncbi:hypothetical protein ACO0QE_000774 [Hanseniaspora vineae]
MTDHIKSEITSPDATPNISQVPLSEISALRNTQISLRTNTRSVESLPLHPGQHRYTYEGADNKNYYASSSVPESPKYSIALSPAPLDTPGPTIPQIYHSNNSLAGKNLANERPVQNSDHTAMKASSPPPPMVFSGTPTALPSLSNILMNDNSNSTSESSLPYVNLPLSSTATPLPPPPPPQQQTANTNKTTGVSTDLTSKKPPQKGKRCYSRNGCQSCKTRRQKCSEEKPSCWNCTRLGRECIYIPKLKNNKRRSKNADSKNGKNDQTTKSKTKKPKVMKKSKPTLSENSAQALNMKNANTLVNEDNIPGLFDDLDSNDVNLLLQDLNDIVSMKLHDSNITLDEYEIPGLEFFNFNAENNTTNTSTSSKTANGNTIGSSEPLSVGNTVSLTKGTPSTFPHLQARTDLRPPNISPSSLSTLPHSGTPPHATTHSPEVPVSVLVDSPITFNTPLDSFKLGGKHDEYLKIFYYDCMDSIAPFAQDQINPLRDTLLSFAKNEAYLLSAILATGASISLRKTKLEDDERLYCQYLTHCLNLLSEQFKEESNLMNNIEPVILTVIMLAWDCVYTMNSQWRSHLKGVTKLFKKINLSSSKVLNLAKCWFKVMETFANISTVLGGALLDEADLDIIFDPYNEQYIESLKFLNVITPVNEFNLIRGHKEDFDLVIKEVIKMLNSIRHSEKNYFNTKGIFNKDLDYLLWSPSSNGVELSYFQIQKILSEIDRQLEYVFIDKSGVIPLTNPSHPNNSGILDNAIDMVKLRTNNEVIAISWYDISHQTQVLSFLLIVLLKLLGIPKESIMIQQVVEKITGFFQFLDSDSPPKNLRTCYCNFAILIAGLNAQDEKTRNIVRKYYKVNGDRFQRLTEHNLNRLEKVWYGVKDSDEKYKLEDQDVLTW